MVAKRHDHDRRNHLSWYSVPSIGYGSARPCPVSFLLFLANSPANNNSLISSALILIVGLGMLSTYTGYVIGQFKLRYPQVHSMGDAGEVMFHPMGLARFGREFLGTAQLLFLIFVMGSHILTFSVMMDTITDHGTCSIVFGIVGLIVSFIFALPRTLRKVSWFSFACRYIDTFAKISFLLITIAFASILGALLITMISIAIQRPGDGKIDVTTTVSLSKGFLAVTNIVFAYGECQHQSAI